MNHTVSENGCWVWQGALNSSGYAPYWYHWTRVKGPKPKGIEIDHTCNNRKCVNTDHMELVTRSENQKRRHQRRPRTHCKLGHLLDGRRTRKEGGKYCKTCVVASKKKQRERKS